MDMVFMFGQMEIDIKDILNNVSNMDKGHKNLPTEIYIKDNMLKENQTDMVNIFGEMVAISRVILRMA